MFETIICKFTIDLELPRNDKHLFKGRSDI